MNASLASTHSSHRHSTGSRWVLLLGSLLVLPSCKTEAEKAQAQAQGAMQEAAAWCSRMSEAAPSPPSPRAMDECTLTFATLGPNQQTCWRSCAKDAKTETDWEHCKGLCFSGSIDPAHTQCMQQCNANAAASGENCQESCKPFEGR